ncbi:MAG: putative glycoside hydrolase, partial [Chloroflexota bacterium]|nr:putative glycoside hydrolase [Chloroflexota bacterium]
HVLDAYTGKPLPGAHLTGPDAAADSGADGAYSLGAVPSGAPVQAGAPGYAPASLDSGNGPTLDISLRPTTIKGHVTDSATGKPLYGVIVRIDLPVGGADVAPAPAAPITPTLTPSSSTLRLQGALPAWRPALVLTDTGATATVPANDSPAGNPTASPAPPTATATPPPAMPTPFANDKVILAVTGPDGSYVIDNAPLNPTLTFKMPGYKLTHVPLGRSAGADVALEPFVAKALYLTANAATYDPLLKPIMDLADNSEINAIVLNIQDDSARVVYKTGVQMANDSKALDLILPNIKEVVADLHKHNLYVIARMVTFMQPAVAEANPGLSVRSKATGKPWQGGQLAQQRWLDPTNPTARQYPIALAREAASLGFDEIQFDYIRFPSDPAPGETWDDMSFSQPVDDTSKPQYIAQFAREAHDMLNMTDAFMSMDIFGYTVWPDQNGKPLNGVIGQVFEPLIGNTDYVSPMIYPSHFSVGELGFSDPNAHPYEIIKQAGLYTQKRIAGQRAKYRPWLQGFDWNHLPYDGHLYRLQIQAAEETGASGWMFWDPSNVYSGDGFNR